MRAGFWRDVVQSDHSRLCTGRQINKQGMNVQGENEEELCLVLSAVRRGGITSGWQAGTGYRNNKKFVVLSLYRFSIKPRRTANIINLKV